MEIVRRLFADIDRIEASLARRVSLYNPLEHFPRGPHLKSQ